jgi:hypothetical protein
MKNLKEIILLPIFGILLLSCSNDKDLKIERNISFKEKSISKLKNLDIEVKIFLQKNEQLKKGGKFDEKLNKYLSKKYFNANKMEPTEGNGNSAPPYPTTRIPLFRFYKNSDHFYTTTYSEGINAGYRYEGVLGFLDNYWHNGSPYMLLRWYNYRNFDRVLPLGAVSLFNHVEILRNTYDRYYDRQGKLEYFITGVVNGITVSKIPDNSSINNPRGDGQWRYEAILGSTFPSGIAIHVYYNKTLNDHLYTNNFNELKNGAHGYVYEGIAFYLK